ncbi:MAG TPA: class II aldolase/adducin family protein [Bacteroidales bacterium]|nr:class II aldolase/adducin family protein [Bacteroidales bacterium]
MIYKEERKAVAAIMRRLYKQGLTTSSGGNVSMKNNEGYIFITASQTDKSTIKWKEIIVIDENGQNTTPELKPSMELGMHLAIYKSRKDIFAVVHAHPVFSSTLAVAGIKPISSVTGESRFILGDISLTEYKTMGSDDLAEACAKSLQNSEVSILKNHGAICVGKNLAEAYNRMEVLELTCRIHYNSLLINSCNEIDTIGIEKIDNMKGSAFNQI